MAAVGSDVVLRTLATTHAVLVTGPALSIVVVLGRWTLGYAVRTVSNVLTGRTVLRIGTGAGTVALIVAGFAVLFISLVDSVMKKK